MKASFLLAGIFLSLQLSAQFSFKGKVSDQNGNALAGANIYFDQHFLGTVSDINGEFIFKNLNPGEYIVNISYMGYGRYDEKININSDINLNFTLHRSALAGEEVIVRAVRAGKRDPVAYSELSREEIKNNNLAQDIPYLLSLTPSLVTSSDAGHGVGYTGFRIRGTDANRINITVDGIPLNDAESHGVFFVNMPDFASSLENVQVQRGVGTSTNGAAAFGASLNFQTNNLNKDPYGEAATSYGSFNTMKNSVKFGTGLLNDHMNLDVRLSRISSDGFIERASADMKSLFVSAGWYSEKSILKLNVISGKEKTYQAWDGVPGYMLGTNRSALAVGRDGELLALG
jgi:iron complex outermembrane receptor protein